MSVTEPGRAAPAKEAARDGAAPLATDRSLPSALTLLVAGAFFMEFFDGSIIATALPRMAPALHSTAIALNVGISAYLLTVAVFILPSGWMAERFGARSVFTAAIVLFTLGSISCGFASSAAGFVASRVLQGLGGAMMVPVGRLAVLRNTAKDELVRAIAVLTWPGLAAPVIAPPIGGFLAEYVSWRWIFFLNVPLGLAGVALSLRLMPRIPATVRRSFDLPGFALAALACLVATVLLDRLGGSAAPAWQPCLLAIVLAALLTMLRRHLRLHPQPLLDMAALQVRSFRAVMLGGTTMRMLVNTLPFLLPLLFQLGYGLNAFHAGLLVLALFAGNLAAKPFTSAIMQRWGFRSVLAGNGLVQAATMLACATVFPLRVLPLTVLLLVLSGASRSLQFTALNTLAFADVPEPLNSTANTMFSLAFQLSLGFGVAIGAVALRGAEAVLGAHDGPGRASFAIAFTAIAALAALVSLDALRLPLDAGSAVLRRRRHA